MVNSRLKDKDWKDGNLKAAWRRVESNKGASGVDGKTVQWFRNNAEREGNISRNGCKAKPISRCWPLGLQDFYIGSMKINDIVLPMVSARFFVVPLFTGLL